ncbi:ATP-binding protein [Streptomyces lavendulocolor]|uniref:sensor histidine kinase n=1 Tax=Streptomyces lavendulocolor TaxID=67316 RepID=UPI003C2BEEE1
MSRLRAPAARPDRREGGRHGRPGARLLPYPGRTRAAASPSAASPSPSLSPDVRLRPRLQRVAVLPPVVVALGGAAAVLVTIRSTGATPSPALWGALSASAALAVAVVAAALLAANRAATAVRDRCDALNRRSARGQNELRALVEQLRRGERPPARQGAAPPSPGGDPFDRLTEELSRAHEVAMTTVVQASRLSSSVGDEQKVEVFVNLARRLQSLVHREIQLLDELENEVEDPELLKGLFHIDHLATRIRRHAENLAVLGGAVSRRQWSHPVTLTEVLRSAVAEVEHYPRVKLVPPVDGTLRGHAVADVIHLLAELVENATLFSAPHTPVLLRAQYVTAGLAVEVEDRGLGMSAAELDRMNALLVDPDQVNVAHLLQDGRIGLFVVSALARRHGIAVRLQSNIFGGVQAVLVLPPGLLGAEPEGLVPAPRHHELQAGRAPVPVEGAPQPTPGPTTGHAPGQPTGQPPGPAPEACTAGAVPGVPHGPGEAAPDEPAGPHLPVRGERSERPPHTAAAPPGAPGRPRLPRRRAQEHLVAQLRDPPAPRRGDDAVHDPGLMAAFRRGIGLAESMPAVSREHGPVPPEAPEPPAPPARPPLPERPAPAGRPEPHRHDEAHKE